MRILRIFYGYSMILHPIRHLELSADKGTKKVRETSDIVMVVANGEHEEHEVKESRQDKLKFV